MKSNFKRLGDYIEAVDEVNKGWKIDLLLGINNNKHFQKSQTNTIGVDLSKYRVVRTNQFAFNRATTRNGEKISISLRNGPDCIVSPSYRIFRSKDENELNSEYLMMWFRRPEFDRYARFRSHGSAHEFFDIDEMYEVRLPIPTIEEQRRIVAEYHTIQNRITLNNQLIQTLETTAQAIYKQWFVEFEFPNEAGQPYKSSGGEMVDSELGEIPKGWEAGPFSAVAQFIMGQSPKGDSYNESGIGEPLINGPVEFGLYFPTQSKWTTKPTKFCEANDLIVCVRGSTVGRFVKSDGRYCLGRGVCSIKGKKSQRFADQLYVASYNQLVGMTTGSTFPSWDRKALANFRVIVPKGDILEKFELIANGFLSYSENLCRQNEPLVEMKNLLLSKLATIETASVALKPAATKPAQLTLSFT